MRFAASQEDRSLTARHASFQMSFLVHRLLLAGTPVFEHTRGVLSPVNLNRRCRPSVRTHHRPFFADPANAFRRKRSRLASSREPRLQRVGPIPSTHFRRIIGPESGILAPGSTRHSFERNAHRIRSNCAPKEAAHHSCFPNSLVTRSFSYPVLRDLSAEQRPLE
jgi:hypothetical protein